MILIHIVKLVKLKVKDLLMLPEKKIDYLILSQFILKTGIKLCKDYIKNDNMIYDKRYIEFKYGISLFNDCDIADIPYKDTKLKKTHEHLAFFIKSISNNDFRL